MMKMTKWLAALAVVALAVSGTAAQAADASGWRGPINVDERLAAKAKRFERLDADGDGFLSAAEFAGAPVLHAMDADADGTVLRPEYDAYYAARKAANQEARAARKAAESDD